MNTKNIDAWVAQERIKVKLYLEKEGIDNPNIGSWPAFEVNPYFAIWAIESKKASGKIGWWAFSGDCPTDYISEDGSNNPRNALGNLIKKWDKYSLYIKKGKMPDDISLGDQGDLKLLGNLLEIRIILLKKWLSNDSIWELK